jgi:hypothetical protein
MLPFDDPVKVRALRMLLRDPEWHTPETKQLSTGITKDDLAAALSVVWHLSSCELGALKDSVMASILVLDLSKAPLTPAMNKTGISGFTEHLSADNTSTQADTAAAAAATAAPAKPKLCKSIWNDERCNTKDCSAAHPQLCRNTACRPRRDPACESWHGRPRKQQTKTRTKAEKPTTKTASGNAHRVPLPQKKGGKQNSGLVLRDIRQVKKIIKQSLSETLQCPTFQSGHNLMMPVPTFASVVSSHPAPPALPHPSSVIPQWVIAMQQQQQQILLAFQRLGA